MEVKEHEHAEAFKQMIYACESCGFMEILYNTRDGVTPFIVSCRNGACQGGMRHVFWRADKQIVDLKPPVGTRVFINTTKEDAKRWAEWHVNEEWDRERPSIPTMRECYEGDKDRAIESQMEQFQHFNVQTAIVQEGGSLRPTYLDRIES